MKHPLRLLIHVPLREEREFRQVLVGFKPALCVTQIGRVVSYDLLPTFKPRKGQEHSLVLHLAEQLKLGWTLVLWDVERLLRDLELLVEAVNIKRPTLKAGIDEAWQLISNADEEQLVDLKVFEKLPNGHYVAMVAFQEDFDFDGYPSRRRRRLIACSRQSRPACEDFWGVLHPFLMSKSDAARAWSAYQRWVRSNRPRPPRGDTR